MDRIIPCINCLMVQGRARKLTRDSDGTYVCDTIGGCSGRFTESFLERVRKQVERLMIASGLTSAQIIAKGTVAESNSADVVQIKVRRVDLPNE